MEADAPFFLVEAHGAHHGARVRLYEKNGAGADSATAQKKYLHSETVQVFFLWRLAQIRPLFVIVKILVVGDIVGRRGAVFVAKIHAFEVAAF